jgi:hypothetical protein
VGQDPEVAQQKHTSWIEETRDKEGDRKVAASKSSVPKGVAAGDDDGLEAGQIPDLRNRLVMLG